MGKNLYFQHGDRQQKASLMLMFRASRAKKKKNLPYRCILAISSLLYASVAKRDVINGAQERKVKPEGY